MDKSPEWQSGYEAGLADANVTIRGLKAAFDKAMAENLKLREAAISR